MAATGPAAADGQWAQVSHRDTVELIHHGAEYMLRNTVSGQVSWLPEGHAWQLGDQGHWAYCAAPGRDALWVSEKLTTKVWRHG